MVVFSLRLGALAVPITIPVAAFRPSRAFACTLTAPLRPVTARASPLALAFALGLVIGLEAQWLCELASSQATTNPLVEDRESFDLVPIRAGWRVSERLWFDKSYEVPLTRLK